MAKKNQVVTRSLSLFEPQNEQCLSQTEKDSPSPVVAKIKDACPRCSGRSLATKRNALETGGTHYCASGCLSEDRTDAFYFTPKQESFDEAAGREEAKKIVASEPPLGMNDGDVQVWVEPPKLEPPTKEIETEAVGEGVQQALIETGDKWEEHWRGMPEFVQEDLAPWKSIYVHFESREDMEKFAKLVKQKIGLNTRSIWYPEAEIGRLATKRYVEGPVDKRTKEDNLR